MTHIACAVVVIVTVTTLIVDGLDQEGPKVRYDSMKSVIMQQFTLPTYHCPLHTIYNGWQSCNAQCLTTESTAQCTVVSFGNPNEYSFENAVLHANPLCSVHVVNRMLLWPWGKPRSVHVHSLQLASTNAHASFTGTEAAHDASFLRPLLSIITDSLNHTVGNVSMLRFNCNLPQPTVIVDGLKALSNRGISVHQVFIRVHFREAAVEEWGKLFRAMQTMSYEMFNRKIPAYVTRQQQIIDYSWVLKGTACAALD